MSYQNLLFNITDHIATITLNRPNKLNALNAALLQELQEALNTVAQDSEIRVLIITGAGERAFCAGADIDELHGITPEKAGAFMLLGQRIFNDIETLGKPVIAAVNGYALGGGCELAQACDLRVASISARFGQPEINLGNIPGWGGTQRLPRLIGAARAKELIFTGELLEAEAAERMGLVNRVTTPEELMPAARSLAAKIAEKGPIALRLAKWAIDRGLDGSLASGLMYENLGVAYCCTTEDQCEGTLAFKERRPPVFKGQ